MKFHFVVATYASLNHAGVHPFIRNPGPSFFMDCIKISKNPLLFAPVVDAALCILLFITSAGAQTVVATVPAANDAVMCTGTPSLRSNQDVERRRLFAAS